MNKALLVIAFVFVLAAPEHGRAQFTGAIYCSNCSTNIQQAAQYAKEVETALQAVEMARMMTVEAKQLLNRPSTNINADIYQMAAILRQSQGLAGDLAEMNRQYNATYGTPYSPHMDGDYAKKYSQWASTVLKSMSGLTQVAGYQGQMLRNEASWTAQIQSLNNGTLGREQSIQLGNSIAAQNVSQLQALRQLLIADMQSKAATTAAAVNREQAEQTAQQIGFAHATMTADQRGW